MSTDRDVSRIVRSWLDEGVTALPDRVLDAVLDQLPAIPQRRAAWLARRFLLVNNTMVRVGMAAAVVILAVILGVNFLGRGVGSPPEATPTPSPAALPAAGQLQPGSYEMSNPAFTPMRFTFTVPRGWATNSDGFVIKHADEPGEVAFTSFIVTHVYANACHWTGTSTKVGTTVDELATALAGQAERKTSVPTAITLGGHAGKRVDLSASPDFAIATCVNSFIRTWPDAGGDESGGWGARDGQTDSAYILDVNGKRVVIDAWHFPGTSATDITELEGIIASIHFAQ